MSRLSLLSRSPRLAVLCSSSEHVVHLARLTRPGERPLVVDAFAEIASGDDAAVAAWLNALPGSRAGGYVAAYCGFHPTHRVLQRETINPRRLSEPDYLPQLLSGHAKIASAGDWHAFAVHASDGNVFTAETAARPGLLIGVPHADVRETQRHWCKLGVRPQRIELGTLALIGALSRHLRGTGQGHALALCEIGRSQTRVYFIAKDGVHTPPPLPHGLLSIEETAMKELGAPDLSTAHQKLCDPACELRAHGRRLVRVLTRHLKPAVDYFEMQTGQPVGALFAGHLPAKLDWIEEALSNAIDVDFLMPNFNVWMPSVGLQLAPGESPPPRSWFQPLSLVAQLASSHDARS